MILLKRSIFQSASALFCDFYHLFRPPQSFRLHLLLRISPFSLATTLLYVRCPRIPFFCRAIPVLSYLLSQQLPDCSEQSAQTAAYININERYETIPTKNTSRNIHAFQRSRKVRIFLLGIENKHTVKTQLDV